MSEDKDKVTDKAQGIIDSLEEDEEERKKEEKIIKKKNKRPNKQKRTYMLTQKQIKKLHDLKVENPGISLSKIVGAAIEEFHKKYSE